VRVVKPPRGFGAAADRESGRRRDRHAGEVGDQASETLRKATYNVNRPAKDGLQQEKPRLLRQRQVENGLSESPGAYAMGICSLVFSNFLHLEMDLIYGATLPASGQPQFGSAMLLRS
jgi:hypothetical protein